MIPLIEIPYRRTKSGPAAENTLLSIVWNKPVSARSMIGRRPYGVRRMSDQSTAERKARRGGLPPLAVGSDEAGGGDGAPGGAAGPAGFGGSRTAVMVARPRTRTPK